MNDKIVISNPWASLRQFTAARIALGRAGVSQPTASQLEFQLAHARARDAVHRALDAEALSQALDDAGMAKGAPTQILHSAASDRHTYLQRPDLGRRLDDASRQALRRLREQAAAPAYDLALVIADGLSALAIEQNALPFLRALLPLLPQEDWSIAPLAIVRQGRVAVGDEVGECLGARTVAVMIGERPGLSSPDSMGVYMTWQPRVGLTDESRNCISNIRPAGMGYAEAASRLAYLLTESRRRQLSGVQLKDETPQGGILTEARRQFLL